MTRKRFRWTRKAYKHAHWLARFAGRQMYEVYQTSDMVRRYKRSNFRCLAEQKLWTEAAVLVQQARAAG